MESVSRMKKRWRDFSLLALLLPLAIIAFLIALALHRSGSADPSTDFYDGATVTDEGR